MRASAAGLSDGEIAETIAYVALNIFTNYLNVSTEVDIVFPKVSYSTLPEAGTFAREFVDNGGMPPLEEETTRFITAWMQLRQLIQAANFNRFQQAGLSATQFMTLNVIPKEGLTLSELARKLNLSPATLNETVNSLEERGLVRRTRQKSDARKVDICATVQGERMQNAASSEFHTFMSSLFGQMSKTRRQGLLTGLEQMVKLSAPSQEDPGTTRRVDDAVPARRSSRRSRQP